MGQRVIIWSEGHSRMPEDHMHGFLMTPRRIQRCTFCHVQCICSVLGYCMLPMVMLSVVAILASLKYAAISRPGIGAVQ